MSPIPCYDAVLLVSFGGPEKPADVMPFLENVCRGKDISPGRIDEVAERYELFGGASPIHSQIRALLAALVGELNAHGPHLPVYWGNRHWHPMLADVLEQMAEDGIRRALAFVSSAFGSPPGCREYLDAIEQARRHVGASAPAVDKLRLFYHHPGFIESMAERAAAALVHVPQERRARLRLVYSAHSIPVAMAEHCPYEAQLHEACRLVSQRLGMTDWQLAYQSRTGPPEQAWLEPDIGQALMALAEAGQTTDVVIVPIGFLVENMEVVYDLDIEVSGLCERLGLGMVRAAPVGNHPRFVAMIRELILERLDANPVRLASGAHGPSPDVCAPDCCRP